jgi:hypothetical protein
VVRSGRGGGSHVAGERPEEQKTGIRTIGILEPVDRCCMHLEGPSQFGNTLPLLQKTNDQFALIGIQLRRPSEADPALT